MTVRYFGLRRLGVVAVVGAVLLTTVASGASPAAATGEPAANDAFSRADSSSLGSAPSGQTWQSHSGSFSIASGQAVSPGGYGLTTLDAGAGAATVSVTVAQPGQEFWVVLRLADGANFWRFGRWQGQQYQLQQIRNNGLGSPSLTPLATVTPAAGDRIECTSGAVLQCAVNGTAVVRTNDSFGSTAGKHGLSTWDSPGVRFDDFSVVAVPLLADLVTSMSAPAVVPSGGTFSATATVVNAGAATASGAAVEWTPPTGVALSAPSGTTCTTSGSTVRCPVGDLAPGATGSVTLTATAPSGSGTVSLPARAVSSGSDATPGDNTATASVTLRPDLSPDTVVSDGFTRTDRADLGRSDTGAAWTTHSGNAGVTNNRAAPGNGYVLATTPSGESTGVVAATVTSTASELWLVMRLSSSADYWRFGRSSGGAYELQQIRNNGLGSPSLDRVSTVTPAAGDRIECKLGASLITCSVNGQVVVRSGDAFNRDATRHGFAAYNASDLRLDDFLVEKATPRPDLRTTVSAPVTMPGSSSATVTTTVRNVGTASAPGTTVRVTLPQGLTPDTAGASSGSCVRSAQAADCTIGAVPAGGTETVTVSARADTTFGTRTVTAAATSSAADEDSSDNTGSASVIVLDPSQPAPLVIDTFARGNGSLGATATGQAWQVLAGSPGVDSQAAAPGAGHALATVNAGRSSGVVSAKLAHAGNEFWLVLRASGSGDYWRFGRSSGGAYQLQLIRNNGLGSPALTTLGTAQAADGDRLECRVAAVISCSVNGQDIVRTSDTTNSGATSYGLSTWNSSPVRFDDFQVLEVPQVADLSAGLTGTRSTTTSGDIRLTATVANTGGATASGSTLAGTLPAGLSDVAVTGPQGSCAVTGRDFSCALGAVAPAAELQVTIAADAPTTAGTVSTTVTAGHSGTDGESGNDSASLSTTIRVPAASGSVVRDEFERSAPAGGGLGTTDSGETWQTLQGGFTISGGEAASTSDTATSLVAVDAGFAFGTYEATVSAGATQPFWLAFRVLDSNNYYRLGAQPWSGEYQLSKVIGGVERPLAFNFTRAARKPANGDVVRIVLRPDDGIYVYVNGEEIIDAGDPQLIDVTGFGFSARSSAPRFDGLQVSQVMEAFPISDTFTRANSETLGAPEQGTRYPWRTWDGYWSLLNGNAHNVTASYGITAIDSATEMAGVSAKVSTAGEQQWLVFRFGEDHSYYRFGAHAGGQYRVELVRDGEVVDLPVSVETVSNQTVASGDALKVVQRLGGAVELSVNGVVTHRFTDNTTNHRATIYGLATQGSLARFDDVTITPPPS